ncbi:MAG: vanadium-dependent haloperoxidase [Saprospiraceae bacterium]
MKNCILLLLLLPLGVLAQPKWEKLASGQLRNVTYSLSEVMLHDGTNPPAASRFYAYALAAGYETLAIYDHSVPDLYGRANDFPVVVMPVSADSVCVPFAVLWAILETGRNIMPSGQELVPKQEGLEQFFRRKQLSETLIAGSKAAANCISRQILAWAKADGYSGLTAQTRYRPGNSPGDWVPTPPDWMAAVEPQWATLRPFLLDTPLRYDIPAPVPFDSVKGSPFYEQMQEVYSTSKQLSEEQRTIALYWDCNPFAVFHAGHMMIGIKKISPAGHWINIIGEACEQYQTPFAKAIQAHAWTALAMADAFIVCWQEKYRTNRIRPITAINRYLDPVWTPVLQTPPFPEYVSGHSVVSTAAAEILSKILGDDRPFTDQTETLYGMAPRRFESFREAANEASISRLYGGIHFRDALVNGQAQGRQVAGQVWLHLTK